MGNDRIVLNRTEKEIQWRHALVDAGISIKQLAEKTGYSYTYISVAIRSGGKGCSKKVEMEIDKALGIA